MFKKTLDKNALACYNACIFILFVKAFEQKRVTQIQSFRELSFGARQCGGCVNTFCEPRAELTVGTAVWERYFPMSQRLTEVISARVL